MYSVHGGRDSAAISVLIWRAELMFACPPPPAPPSLPLSYLAKYPPVPITIAQQLLFPLWQPPSAHLYFAHQQTVPSRGYRL